MSTIARRTHVSDLQPGEDSKLMHNISYFDGFARTIQSKSYAGPGHLMFDPNTNTNVNINFINPQQKESRETVVPHRWIGNGWTIFNNKGNAVRKYEPFYSPTPTYEFGVAVGVTATLFYDPLQRVVATLFPDHSWSKSTFGPWSSEQWDANDTVVRNTLGDPDVGAFFRRLLPVAADSSRPTREQGPLLTWYEQRIDGQMGRHEREAAVKAAAHADTPTLLFLDSMGRTFLTVEHNKKLKCKTHGRPVSRHAEKASVGVGDAVVFEDEFVRDITIYDIEGNKRAIIDGLGRKICVFDWDMSGTKVHQASMEAGELWMLHDVSQSLVIGRDSRGQRFRTVHDVLRRAVDVYLSHDDDKTEKLIERTVYGEAVPDPEKRNLRQRAYRVLDQAGIVSSEKYDFKGNILTTQRHFAKDYKGVLDWTAHVELEEDRLVQTMIYDAANRKIRETTADKSTVHYQHNDVGLIQQIQVQLQGAEEKFAYLKDLEYNARGQRVWVEHGNKTVTTNTYDEATFHLKNVVTYLNSQSSPRKRHPRTDRNCSMVQNLHYTYDPIGNVTHIEDQAQQSIFFRNKRVDPSGHYTYDALYRLIEATGREHLGQTAQSGSTSSMGFMSGALEPLSREHAHDETAMSRYTERYVYDLTGNILQLHHGSADEKRGSWTRQFAYEESSLIEPEKRCNRLTRMTTGSEAQTFKYEGPEGRVGSWYL